MNKLHLLQATVLDLNPERDRNNWIMFQRKYFRCWIKIKRLWTVSMWPKKTGNRGGGVLLYLIDVLNPVEFHTKSEYGPRSSPWH